VIYDTMTVYENLAFPLRNRGWKSADIRSRVQHIAHMLELEGDLKNSASGLGADIKQKISLGRGLVRPDVAAVLFDEPLTVIDPQLKWLLRRKLKQIHHELKLSLIYVTHDQTEALTFADRVVVMAQGEVVQVGTPQELFERPAHRFVGYFIGSPGMNFIPCVWVDDTARVAGAVVATQSESPPPQVGELCIGIRPEHIQLKGATNENQVPVRVLDVRDVGTHVMARLEVAGAPIHAKFDQVSVDEARATQYVYLPPHRCALYSGERRVQ
jgi:glycerol transport system ATP-binding protein